MKLVYSTARLYDINPCELIIPLYIDFALKKREELRVKRFLFKNICLPEKRKGSNNSHRL